MVGYGSEIAAVVIGRNEGARLVACLKSLKAAGFEKIVYVDSGSTDGSVDAATGLGAQVVALDMSQPFTAARGRNAGLDALGILDNAGTTPWSYIQFVDGDCEVNADWARKALDFLDTHDDVAVAAGRLREKFPDASIYNRICDDEWAEIPIGEIRACGGIMMARADVLRDVGGFNPSMIAGEESELCIRIKRQGHKIWRVDAEMALHDAAMTRFGQFMKRARRNGYANAEGAAMYGKAPERHRVAGVRRILLWAVIIPALILLALVVFGWPALITLAIYPVQITRTALRAGGSRVAWERAALMTFSKFSEALGIAEYHLRTRKSGPAKLIEYK